MFRDEPLTPHDQSPAFKLISTKRTKAGDGMFAITFWGLIYDYTKVVPALGAVSSDVFSHRGGFISLTRTLTQVLRFGSGSRPSRCHAFSQRVQSRRGFF